MILNAPNVLVIIRIILIPFMIWLMVDRDNLLLSNIHYSWLDYFTALIFVIASITDFFDGFIARQWNQKTILGSIIDPLADKMLILGSFIGLMILSRANIWAVYLILVREFFISGIRVMAAEQNFSIPSSIWGKSKTVIQMFAIGFLMMNWPYGSAILWISVFFTLYSGYEYIIDFSKKIK